MTRLEDLREQHIRLREKIKELEKERIALKERLDAEFKAEFGRWPESVDDHFYLAGGPRPEV